MNRRDEHCPLPATTAGMPEEGHRTPAGSGCENLARRTDAPFQEPESVVAPTYSEWNPNANIVSKLRKGAPVVYAATEIPNKIRNQATCLPFGTEGAPQYPFSGRRWVRLDSGRLLSRPEQNLESFVRPVGEVGDGARPRG